VLISMVWGRLTRRGRHDVALLPGLSLRHT
jgi:hypothetical protein